MVEVLIVGSVYLLLGLLAIIALEILTGRVRSRLWVASQDTEIVTGGGRWVALTVTLLALWCFWPFAIFAALSNKGDKDGS